MKKFFFLASAKSLISICMFAIATISFCSYAKQNSVIETRNINNEIFRDGKLFYSDKFASTFIALDLEWSRCPLTKSSKVMPQRIENNECPNQTDNKLTFMESVELANSIGDGWRLPTVQELSLLQFHIRKSLDHKASCELRNEVNSNLHLVDAYEIWTTILLNEKDVRYLMSTAQARVFNWRQCVPRVFTEHDDVSVNNKRIAYVVRSLTGVESPSWLNALRAVQEGTTKLNQAANVRYDQQKQEQVGMVSRLFSPPTNQSEPSNKKGVYRMDFQDGGKSIYVSCHNKKIATPSKMDNGSWWYDGSSYPTASAAAEAVCR